MRRIATLLLAAMLPLGLFWAAGWRVNTSPSIPVGLYRLTDEPVTRGRFVIVCPPNTAEFAQARDRGYLAPGLCPGNFGYLMKRVVGVPGDALTVEHERVAVNGRSIPLSAQRDLDGLGRALRHYTAQRRVLGTSEYFLMSTSNPNSFDARYFGPLDRAHILSRIEPVITW